MTKGGGATDKLAAWISDGASDPASTAAVRVAKHALLDWLGVALAARDEPLAEILVRDAVHNDETGSCPVVGRSERLTPATAALVNGAISHALDFDDVNKRMRGHPSVAIVPALLAAAHGRRVSGRSFLDALVSGTEIACHVGEMLGVEHYQRGFHATATVGAIAAAAGCARLTDLTCDQAARALGLAATQAAGLQAMFGTMAKPLHAGLAARNGLLVARWAGAGFEAAPSALEAPRGFGVTHSLEFRAELEMTGPTKRFGIEDNVFKYHAACYYTHSAIEAAAQLVRQANVAPQEVSSVSVTLSPTELNVCNIASPRSGLEVKFSIRHLVAMALLGVDTGDVRNFTDAVAVDPSVVAMRDRVSVTSAPLASRTAARVAIELGGERQLACEVDVGIPATDLDAQEHRLRKKFIRLTGEVFGIERAGALCDLVLSLEEHAGLEELMVLITCDQELS